MGTSPFAMPRIVHLAHAASSGGAEMALTRLLAAETEWEPSLLLPPVGHENVFADIATPRWTHGVRQHSGASSHSGLRLLDFGLRLLVQAVVTRWHKTVRDSDLIVANSTRAAAYGALAVSGTGRRFAVHLRDQVTRESLGGFGYLVMTKLILPRADGIIANSHSTLETARPFLRTDAVAAVIPSPSGLHRITRAARGQQPFRIGMLARLDPWKGQLALLEAFAQGFADSDVELELAGGAPFGHHDFAVQLRERAKELGIGDRVFLPGHVSDIAPLLARWDIAVQYSLRPEPMGQNVLQCLAAGTALVVAAEGGPTEWVQHERNGLHVEPRSIPDLTAALRRLADDRVLRERLGNAAALTPGLLSDTEIASLHADVYRRVIDHDTSGERDTTAKLSALIPGMSKVPRAVIPSRTAAFQAKPAR